MQPDQPQRQQSRAFLSVVFIALVLWQTYLAFLNARMAGARTLLFDGLGVELSKMAQMVISGLSFGPVVPVFTTLLAADVLRRKQLSTGYGVVALAVTIAITLLFQVAMMEAWFRPIFTIIEQIG